MVPTFQIRHWDEDSNVNINQHKTTSLDTHRPLLPASKKRCYISNRLRQFSTSKDQIKKGHVCINSLCDTNKKRLHYCQFLYIYMYTIVYLHILSLSLYIIQLYNYIYSYITIYIVLYKYIYIYIIYVYIYNNNHLHIQFPYKIK